MSKLSLEEKRAILKAKIAESRANRKISKRTPVPRYDEIYYRGTQWLDSCAGEPIPNGTYVLISDDPDPE